MTKRFIIIFSLLIGSVSHAIYHRSGDVNLALKPPTNCPARAALDLNATSNERQNTRSGKSVIMQADAKKFIEGSPSRRGSK